MGLREDYEKKYGKITSKPTSNTETKEVKTTTSPTGKTEVKDPAVNKFEDTYGEAIRGNKELSAQWSYKTGPTGTRQYIKAVNGKYDSIINDEGADKELRGSLSTFKEKSVLAANLAKKGFTNQANVDAYNNARKGAFDAWNQAQTAFSKNAKYVYDDDSARILTKQEYEKNTSEVQTMDGKNNNTVLDNEMDPSKLVTKDGVSQFVRGEGDVKRVSWASGYSKIEAYETGFRNTLENKTKVYVGEWLNTGLKNLNNADDKSNRSITYQIAVDILKHGDKYGTKAKGADGKIEARAVLEKMWKAKTFAEKIEVIKQNKDAISNIHADMGYYGNAHVFNKYAKGPLKDKVAFNNKYYSETGSGSELDSEKLISAIPRLDAYNDKFSKFKDRMDVAHNQAYAELKYDDNVKLIKKSDLAIKDLVDKQGNITSFKKWYARLEEQGKFVKDEATYSSNSITGAPISTEAGSRFITYADNLYSNNMGFGSGGRMETLRQVYNKVVHAYKMRHDLIQNNIKAKYSPIKIGVGGETESYNIGYGHVDITTNKDGYVQNDANVKQRNISAIIGMLKKTNGDFDLSNVAVFAGDDYKTVDEEEFKTAAEKNPENFQKYFKPGSNMDNYTMTFVKGTGVSNTSAYVFKNKDTGKSFSIMANKRAMNQVTYNDGSRGEYFNKNTEMTSDEYLFQMNGEKKLAVSSNIPKDLGIIGATIREVDGVKQLVYSLEDTKKHTIILGPSSQLDIKKAEELAYLKMRNLR
jgi:hypothetical protein